MKRASKSIFPLSEKRARLDGCERQLDVFAAAAATSESPPIITLRLIAPELLHRQEGGGGQAVALVDRPLTTSHS